MSSEFLKDLLSAEGMADGRAAVVGTYEWFTHGRVVDHYEIIKANGIPLSWPEGMYQQEEIIEVLGEDAQNIICLSPYPKHHNMNLNKCGASMFKMALHRDALPARIGLDCTFGGTYAKAAQLRVANPNALRGDVFLYMVKDREVVVSFDVVPPEVLRVCPKEAPHSHPSFWPMMAATKFENVAIFDPDPIGNVSL